MSKCAGKKVGCCLAVAWSCFPLWRAEQLDSTRGFRRGLFESHGTQRFVLRARSSSTAAMSSQAAQGHPLNSGRDIGASGSQEISTPQTFSQLSDTSLTSPAEASAIKAEISANANIVAIIPDRFSIAASSWKKHQAGTKLSHVRGEAQEFARIRLDVL